MNFLEVYDSADQRLFIKAEAIQQFKYDSTSEGRLTLWIKTATDELTIFISEDEFSRFISWATPDID